MVALGLVLLVLSGLLTLGIVLSNTDPANAAAFGVSLSGVSIGGLFLVGVITGAVAMLGLAMMFGGAARRRRTRVATKRQLRETHGERETLAEENARLAAELEAQRSTRVADDSYPVEDDGVATGRRQQRL